MNPDDVLLAAVRTRAYEREHYRCSNDDPAQQQADEMKRLDDAVSFAWNEAVIAGLSASDVEAAMSSGEKDARRDCGIERA